MKRMIKMIREKRLIVKFIAVAMINVLIIGILAAVLPGSWNHTEPPAAKAQEAEPVSRTQAMNGVNKDVVWELISEKRINENNYRQFVKITDAKGRLAEYGFSDKGNGCFHITPPPNGYEPGGTYIVSLGEGVRFQDTEIALDGDFYFSVEKENVENVVFHDSVRHLTPDQVVITEDGKIKVIGVPVAEGDILMIPVADQTVNEVSVKVTGITAQSEGETFIEVETPDTTEVLASEELYGTYTPTLTDEQYAEYMSAENVEKVKAQAMNIPYARAVNDVLSEYYASENQRLGLNNIRLVPKIEVKILGAQNISSGKKNPWEFSITFTWSLVSKNNVSVKVKLELLLKQEVDTFVNVVDGVRNTATISKTSIGFQLNIEGELDFDLHTDIGRNHRIIKHGKYFNEVVNKWGDLSPEEQLKTLEDDYFYKRGDRYMPPKKERIKKENEIIKAKNDKRKIFKELVDAKVSEEVNESDSVIRLFSFHYIITPGVTFSMNLDFFVNINFTGEFGTKHEISWINESGTVEYRGDTRNYHNEKQIMYSGNLYLQGTVTIKAGLRGEASFSFAGIISVGIQMEGGAYAEFKGMGSFAWGDYDKTAYDECPWALHFETGFYLELNAFVRVDLIEWLVGKDSATSKIPVFEYKWKLYEWGNDLVEDLTPGAEDYASITNPKEELFTLMISEDGIGTLPTLNKRVYNLVSGETTNFNIPYTDYLLEFSEFVYYRDGKAYLRDSNVQEFEEVVLAYLRDENGKIDDNTFLPIRIKKLPVKVESVALSYGGAGITSGGQDSVKVDITPTNASYQNVEYYVEYVVRNGQRLTENLNAYARTDSTGTVSLLNTLSYGDKVGLSAKAVVDNVESNLLELTVAKTSVREIRLTAEGLRSDVQPGESLTLVPKINPLNATFQNVDLTIVSGAEFGTLSEDGRTLVCKENTPVNSEIRIVAAADGVTSREFIVRVGAIPVESVAVKEETTDTYLSKVTPIQLGSVIKLSAVASPENTTEHRSYFAVTKNPYAATVSEDGELRITGDSVYVGKTVKVLASYGGVNSEEYEFLIEKVPVEQLILTSQQNSTEVRPGGRLQLYTQVLPHNATFFSVNYTVIEGGEYAAVNEYGTLSVFSNAPVGAVIKIQSNAEGVYGNIITVNVVKIPVSEVSISANGVKSVEAGGFLRLAYTILPLNASYRNIAFHLIEGEAYASVSPEGVLTVNGAVGIPDARIGVIAYVDGVYSNALYFDVIVPVQSVAVSLEGGVAEMQLGSFAQIQTQVNPSYATNTDITYEITNNARFAKINAAYGYLSINYDAAVGEQVGFIAIVDGVRSEEYFVTITKIPVTHIALNCAAEIEVGLGKSYWLSAQAAPLNATYSEIAYVLLSGSEIAHIGADGTLTISPDAKVGDKVTWKAVADGVESETVTVTVVPVRVSYLEIFAENNELRPGGRAQITCKINEDATDKNVTYRIVEGAEYAAISADGVLAVQPTIMTGNAVVKVAATAGGLESNCLAFRIFVPVEYILLTSESGTAAPGERFLVTPGVNPNATDQTVRVEIVRGAEYISSVSGGLYAVIPNVAVPDAQIVLRAFAQGVESNELTIDIHVPVENVRLSASDFAPKQGDTVTLRGAVTPAYATDQTMRYSLVMPVEGVTLNETAGELQIAHSVPVGTQILVEAACDGVVSETLILRVHRVPVESVRICANAEALMQGQSMAFSASVLPETATFKEVRYAITAGAGYGKINGNLLTVHQNAPVGEKLCVTATADGVTSAEYEITILKVPVAFVEIHTGGVNVVNAGETVQFFGTVSENATYGTIVYRILDGGDYGSITADGMLAVNRYVPVPNAVIRVVGRADGVDSNVYALSVYNPVTNITISADQTVLRPGGSFTVSAAVNANATDPNVEFGVVAGSEYLTVLENGSYAIRTDIRVANAVIRIRALKDGVVSNEIAISVYIDVTGVELANAAFDIMQGESVTLTGRVTPSYATNASVVYALKDPVNGVTLNTTTGALTVSKTATVGDAITVYAIADGVRSRDYQFTVCKIPVSDVEIMDGCSEVSVMQGHTLQFKVSVYPEDATYQNVTFAIDAPASVATISQTGLLTVSANAPVGRKIRVSVTADGKTSECTVAVAKVPVTGVSVRHNAANSGRVLRGDRIRLTAEALPASATYRSIVYSVVSGGDYAAVDANGVITVASDIRVRDAQFIVRAASADNPNAYADTAFTVYIPATGISLTASNTRPTSTATGGSTVVFTALPVPAYASAQAASYELVSGGSYGTLSGNVLTVKSDIRVPDAKLTVRAGIEGITREVTVNVVVPAASVSFQTPVLLASGTESASALYRVKAAVAPSYATDPSVTYSVSSRYASINSLTGELTVYSDAPNNFSVVVTATASNGVSKAYTVNQANATGLTLSRIARSSTNTAIEWDGARNTDDSVTYSANKALPGDVLRVEAAFSPNPSFKNYEVIEGFGYTVNADRKSITISPLSKFNSDIPSVTVTIRTTHNGTMLAAAKTIYIYLPVEEVSMNLEEVKRGETTDLTDHITLNSGYATNKSFSLEGLPDGANGKEQGIEVAKAAPAGTEFTFSVVTEDGTFSTNAASKSGFKLRVAALTEEELGKLTFEFGNDSVNNVRVISQLENGSYVYVTPKFGAESVSLYGMEFTASKTGGCSDVEVKTEPNDGVNSVKLNVYKYVNNSTKNSEVSGRGNSFTFQIEITDGSSGVIKTFTKTIDIFNRINEKAKVEFTNDKITAKVTQLSVNIDDSLATTKGEDMLFEKTSVSKYTVTTAGVLTVQTLTPETINIKIYCNQRYNASTIGYSVTKELKVLNRGYTSFETGNKFQSGGLGTSFTGWATLDVISDQYQDDFCFPLLRELGYTKMTIGLDFHVNVWGTIEYQFRLYDVTDGKELYVQSAYTSPNGEDSDKSYTFQVVDISNIDSSHKIEVQLKYRKTIAIWGGDFTIQANRSYSVNFS